MKKMQKLDPKQVPQVIVLGALCAAVLGYGGYTFLSGSSPNTAQADPAQKDPEGGSEVGVQGSGVQGADGDVRAPGKRVAQGGSLPAPPPIFNPDPFKPNAKPAQGSAVGVQGSVQGSEVGVQGSGGGGAGFTGDPLPPPGPGQGSGFGAPGSGGGDGSAGASPSQPVKPTRPILAVTGIIDVDTQGGNDMALIELGSEQRILRVGDRLPNGYYVKRIALDGVLLVHHGGGSVLRDRYFVALGNKSQLGAPSQLASE